MRRSPAGRALGLGVGPQVRKPDPLGQSADIRMGVVKGLNPLSIECSGVTIDNESVIISDSLPAAVGDACLVAVFGDGLHWVFSVKGDDA